MCCRSRRTDANTNRQSKTGGTTFSANKQLGVEIKRSVRMCPETPACRDRSHTYVSKTLSGAPGVFFRHLHERTNRARDGKKGVWRGPRGLGSSSIRGLHPRLHLSPRPRLVQTRAPGVKPWLNHVAELPQPCRNKQRAFLHRHATFFYAVASLLCPTAEAKSSTPFVCSLSALPPHRR